MLSRLLASLTRLFKRNNNWDGYKAVDSAKVDSAEEFQRRNES